MIVRVAALFQSPTTEDESSLRLAARNLTNDRSSVRVFPREDSPGWLIAEFTMPAEAQNTAVGKIDRALRLAVPDRMDLTIAFPKSDEEIQSAKRKAERRRKRRL